MDTTSFWDTLTNINNAVNDFVWVKIGIVLLIGTGILMLITCGGCGIWYLIDIFTVCTEQYTDSDGNRILMYI